MIAADHVLAIDNTLIPTGELVEANEDPFDFTSPKTIGNLRGRPRDVGL